jgi:soluble lytic murein transglycosylase-like protein
VPLVRIDAVRDAALSWHIPPAVESIRGLRLFVDAPRGGGVDASIVRSIVRANPRIGPLDALQLAIVARRAAEQAGLPPFFVAATMLQESAFDPSAVSDAGAFGIAQFTFPTAAEYGIDPFEPRVAIAGAAALLARYVATYAQRPGDRYALALAAYNAGPGAVAYYGGVPPYPETREYIADVYERWGRLVRER